ncbi:hypothetical protein VPH35_129511 [Triticum aestivum]
MRHPLLPPSSSPDSAELGPSNHHPRPDPSGARRRCRAAAGSMQLTLNPIVLKTWLHRAAGFQQDPPHLPQDPDSPTFLPQLVAIQWLHAAAPMPACMRLALHHLLQPKGGTATVGVGA